MPPPPARFDRFARFARFESQLIMNEGMGGWIELKLSLDDDDGIECGEDRGDVERGAGVVVAESLKTDYFFRPAAAASVTVVVQ